ncbi:MAG: hypothetical protein WC849_03635 [Candidatus Paceibacterota bacterium]
MALKKLTPKHLEVLAKLATNQEPINYQEFLPDLNPVLDLAEYHLVNKLSGSYALSSKGKDYFNKILQSASRYLKKDISINSLD